MADETLKTIEFLKLLEPLQRSLEQHAVSSLKPPEDELPDTQKGVQYLLTVLTLPSVVTCFYRQNLLIEYINARIVKNDNILLHKKLQIDTYYKDICKTGEVEKHLRFGKTHSK